MKRIVFVALLAGLIVLPNLGLYQRLSGRDPGIFSYIGKQLVDGKALYRDAWDSKGPLIFYLYALGVLIGDRSGWGVELLNYLFVFAAILFAEAGLRRGFGGRAAAFGLLGCIVGLLIISSYLGIEMAALPFECAALYLYVCWQADRESPWYAVLIGVTGALAFLLRPNNVGMQLSIGLLTLYSGAMARRWKRTAFDLSMILIGAVIPLALVAGYFASQNTLGDLIDASIIYNMSYSNTTMLARGISALYGLALLTGVTVTAGAGLLLWWANPFGSRLRPIQRRLLALALVDLPVEIILATLSGRNYSHYYLLWLPAFAVLIAYLFYALLGDFEFFRQKFQYAVGQVLGLIRVPFSGGLSAWLDRLLSRERARDFIVIGLSLLLAINGLAFTFRKSWLALGADPNQPVVEYISSHTRPGEYVLMWSAEIGFNFLAARPSPGRYATQYPLFTAGYQNQAMIAGLLADLSQEHPVIIDCSSSDKLSPPIDDAQRRLWQPYLSNWGLLPDMEDVFKYIHAHYQRVDVVGPNNWIVYVYVDN